MIVEEQSMVASRHENISTESSVMNNPLGYADSPTNFEASCPPPYSTLPSDGHRRITMSTINENTTDVVNKTHRMTTPGDQSLNGPARENNRELQRSETTTSEEWYDANTLLR